MVHSTVYSLLYPLLPCTPSIATMYTIHCYHVHHPLLPCTPFIPTMYTIHCYHVHHPLLPCIPSIATMYTIHSSHYTHPLLPYIPTSVITGTLDAIRVGPIYVYPANGPHVGYMACRRTAFNPLCIGAAQE